jgi:hypothetical protein
MKRKISKKSIAIISEKTIKAKKPEVVALLKKYGMDVNVSDSDDKINKAFISLVPRSRGFRNDFSVLATDIAKNMNAGELAMSGNDYMSLTGRGITTTSEDLLKPTGGVNVRGTSSTTTNTQKSFDETRVGQILSNDSIKNLINTGLGVWAYKKTGGTVGQDSLLNSATVGGGVPTPVGGGSDQKSEDKKEGMGVGTIVLISVGALALIGGLLVIVNKSGKA